MTALTNLFKYSEDSKEIFMQKGGIEFLLQKLRSKQEKVLEVALKLLLALIHKGDMQAKKIAMRNDFQTIQVLVEILKKPKIDFTDYKCSTRHTVVAVLRKLIKGSTEVLLELLTPKYEGDLKDLIDLS